jgi:hypothetical protein
MITSAADPNCLHVSFWAPGGSGPLVDLPRQNYLRILDTARAAGWEPQKPSKTTGDLQKDFMNYLPPTKLDGIDADYLVETLGQVCSTIADSELGMVCAQLLAAKEFRAGFEVRAS